MIYLFPPWEPEQRASLPAPLHSVLTPKRWLSSTSALLGWVCGAWASFINDSGNVNKPGQLTFASFMNLPLSKEDAATMNILQAAQAAKVRTLSVRTLSVI